MTEKDRLLLYGLPRAQDIWLVKTWGCYGRPAMPTLACRFAFVKEIRQWQKQINQTQRPLSRR